MSLRRTPLILFALAAATTASAQFNITHTAGAYAYNPQVDRHTETIASAMEWNARNRETLLTALSESHPFDPPPNVARSLSHFVQPTYGDATLRALSFTLSDYSGIGTYYGYTAKTEFEMRQRLVVETGGASGGSYALKLYVPMHGLVAARGNANAPSGSIESYGSATSRVTVSDPTTGSELAGTRGSVEYVDAGYNSHTVTTTGDWLGHAVETDVTLPLAEARTVRGAELTTATLLDLGNVASNSRYEFDVRFVLNTYAQNKSSGATFGLSDFSATGGFEFQAFDGSGGRFTDFTVNPVPEPATFAALGLGAAWVSRRRRL